MEMNEARSKSAGTAAAKLARDTVSSRLIQAEAVLLLLMVQLENERDGTGEKLAVEQHINTVWAAKQLVCDAMTAAYESEYETRSTVN